MLSQLEVPNLKMEAIYFVETVASIDHTATDWHDP
jgi:hypothetical protein